jgi:hypothetical protein
MIGMIALFYAILVTKREVADHKVICILLAIRLVRRSIGETETVGKRYISVKNNDKNKI